MEKYNLNEGNDALKRVLLMMKYDAKKTLTENVEEIEAVNEDTADVAIGSTAAGAGLGAAATGLGILPGTAVVGAGTAGGAMTIGVTGVGAAAEAVAGALGIGLAGGAAVLGGAAALAVLPLAYWLITKDDGSGKVKKMFEMCSTDSAKIAKLPRKLGETDFRSMSDDIDDAINEKTWGFMAGTDEEKLFATFKKLESGTASDFCAFIKYYNSHSDSGDLFDDLDSDIDSEEEWKQIYRPIRNCVEDSLKTIADDTIKDCKTNPNQAKCKTGGDGDKTKPKYKDCTGTYTQGCKSDVIKKVQGCLNVKTDGLFGPITQGALESKGFKNGFTDADVEKLCPANVVVEPPVKPEDEYGYSDNSGNTPFDSTIGYVSGDDASLDTLH